MSLHNINKTYLRPLLLKLSYSQIQTRFYYDRFEIC